MKTTYSVTTAGQHAEYKFLVSVPVKAYYNKQDEDPVEEAFSWACSDYATVEDQLEDQIREILGRKDTKKLAFSFPEFEEFDLEDYRKSRAYFTMLVEGPQNLITKVIRKMGDTLVLKAKEVK